jgi:hypothetical protein
MSVPRGVRNNNPGNIRLGQAWKGLALEQTDSAFCQFTSMAYGTRAIASIMYTYLRKYGLNTVNQIIHRWAPPEDLNDTSAYVAYVCGVLDVGPDEPIDVTNKDVMAKLIRAIVTQENGAAAATLVSDVDIENGISLTVV